MALLVPRTASMGITLLLRPARVTAHGMATLFDNWSAEMPRFVSRIETEEKLAAAAEFASSTTPSLLVPPASISNAPEKLLVPVRTKTPRPDLVKVAEPEMVPLAVRFGATVQVWSAARLSALLRVTL